MKFVLTMLLTLFAIHVQADDHGDKGFTMDVKVSGFFNPEVTQAIIKSVVSHSSADTQGLAIGHEVVAIDGCKIPGCSASQAKQSLQKHIGETVVLSMLKPDGTRYEATVTLQ